MSPVYGRVVSVQPADGTADIVRRDRVLFESRSVDDDDTGIQTRCLRQLYISSSSYCYSYSYSYIAARSGTQANGDDDRFEHIHFKTIRITVKKKKKKKLI